MNTNANTHATRPAIDRIADAVLYEGYILYPYRPSTKNRQRWTFGGLFPEAYRRSQGDSDRSSFRAECLVRGTPSTALNVRVRFLHLIARQVGVIEPPLPRWPGGDSDEVGAWRPVESLRVGESRYQTWQEARERDVRVGDVRLDELAKSAHEVDFDFPASRAIEPIEEEAGQVVGLLAREQRAVEGRIQLSATALARDVFRLRLEVTCRSPVADGVGREEALLSALASTHAILEVRDGAFLSLLDPPDDWREAAAACTNLGVWPVLVGEEGRADAVLVSPIILYDYPQIAPESPGDLFDGLEIDEILSLRIMTLTDDEKAEMAAVDDRAGALLARTEALAREQWLGLHGSVRGPRSTPSGGG